MSTLGLNEDEPPPEKRSSEEAFTVIGSLIVGYMVGRTFGLLGILAGLAVYFLVKFIIKTIRGRSKNST